MFGYTSLNDLPQLPRYKLDENQQIIIDDLNDEKYKEEVKSLEENNEKRNLEKDVENKFKSVDQEYKSGEPMPEKGIEG